MEVKPSVGIAVNEYSRTRSFKYTTAFKFISFTMHCYNKGRNIRETIFYHNIEYIHTCAFRHWQCSWIYAKKKTNSGTFQSQKNVSCVKAISNDIQI